MINPDYKQLIESMLKIETKEAELAPFLLNPIQEHYLANRTNRDIVLKARQMGFSSLITAIFLLDCIRYKNIKAVVLSHETKATQRLLQKVRGYIKHLPEPGVQLDTESKDELYFPKTNSRFFIGTAGSKAFGRGDTINRLHLSEAAFWENPTMLTGLLEAVPNNPNSYVVFETTANGMGNDFHTRWINAVNKESSYTPHFYSWANFPEYRAKDTVLPTPDEQEIMDMYGLDIHQIAWRRYKIANMSRDDQGKNPEDLFMQEYPLSWQEAFVSSGSGAFSAKALNALKLEPGTKGGLYSYGTKIVPEADQRGFWTFYRPIQHGKFYSIGADVASGQERGDFCAAEIIDNDTLEQVAEFRGQLPVDLFAEELYRAGVYANYAMLGVEVNNQGLAVLEYLRIKNYPNLYYRIDRATKGGGAKLGWETNARTRPLMIDYMAGLIRQAQFIIRSQHLQSECLSFVKNQKGKYEAVRGAHDDLVIASAIALQVYKEYPKTAKRQIDREDDREERKDRKRKKFLQRDSFSSIQI